jgi:hypothetical protein
LRINSAVHKARHYQRGSNQRQTSELCRSFRLFEITCYSRARALTYQLSVASVERASLHLSRHNDFRALLRNWPALVDAPIHRVDINDHRLFKTRLAVRGDSANV